MLRERRPDRPPEYSICIPQFNRTNFLLKALESYAGQTFCDFEVCISDDCSTDGRQGELLAWLDASGLPYAYQLREKNCRYDGNLRSAIDLARGRYCLLMGNDDALAGPDALAGLAEDIARLGPASVVITDFADYSTGARAGRIRVSRNCGAGPAVAAEHYRNFSFVSGILLLRELAQKFASDRWDGSEMYQMYIGCRIIASGSPLLELERVFVHKDVAIAGEVVDSYARKPRVSPCPIVERELPLNQLGRLVASAFAPYCGREERKRLNERVFRQLFQYTYPFWLVEYRRVQSWRYAVGVALAMRPKRTLAEVELGHRRSRVEWLYRLATLAGLTVPLGLFDRLRQVLYRFAKR